MLDIGCMTIVLVHITTLENFVSKLPAYIQIQIELWMHSDPYPTLPGMGGRQTNHSNDQVTSAPPLDDQFQIMRAERERGRKNVES